MNAERASLPSALLPLGTRYACAMAMAVAVAVAVAVVAVAAVAAVAWAQLRPSYAARLLGTAARWVFFACKVSPIR